VVVLLQSGQAADLAGAFGGMGSQTTFGPRGSVTLLSKATAAAAAIFMLTSLTLSIMRIRDRGSQSTVLEKAPATAPAKNEPGVPAKQGPMELNMPGGQKIPIPLPPKPGAKGSEQKAPATQAAPATQQAPATKESPKK
jgi:preprotein translocase subunit SecG